MANQQRANLIRITSTHLVPGGIMVFFTARALSSHQ